MDTGPEGDPYTIEPIEDPVPRERPEPAEPAPAAPERDPELVPA